MQIYTFIQDSQKALQLSLKILQCRDSSKIKQFHIQDKLEAENKTLPDHHPWDFDFQYMITLQHVDF